MSLLIWGTLCSSIQAFAYINEPQYLKGDDNHYKNLVGQLNLDSVRQSSNRINILVLGLDRGPEDTKNRARYTLANGSIVWGLNTRVDAINLVSIDLTNRAEHKVIGMHSGTLAPNACWDKVVAGEKNVILDKTFSALLPLGGRQNFIKCVSDYLTSVLNKSQFTDALNSRSLFDDQNNLPIHYFVEVNYQGFVTAYNAAVDVVSAQKSLILKVVPLNQFLKVNQQQITSALRGKQTYNATGFQKLFNNAKMVAATFGYLGSAEKVQKNFHVKLNPIFKSLSYSHSFSHIINSIKSRSQSVDIFSTLAWKQQASGSLPQFDIVLIGSDQLSGLIMNKQGGVSYIESASKSNSTMALFKDINFNQLRLPLPHN